MPRPKRSKVTPSYPVQRVEQKAPLALAASEKDVFSPLSSRRVPNPSDDSGSLAVINKRVPRTRTSMAQSYTMSGALAVEDVGSFQSRLPSAQTRATLSRIVREADHAKAAGSEMKKVTRATLTEVSEQIPSSIPSKGTQARRTSVSRLGHSSVQRNSQAGSGTTTQGIPYMHSSSMLGGATFKKRLRQPSLLRMAQSRNNTSDELDDIDMYDFMPDDESTPIIKSLSQTNVQSTSSSSHQLSGSRKRKMRSPEIQVPASQSFQMASSPSAIPSPPDHEEEHSEDDDQFQPTLPPPRSIQTPPPEIFSETLAPPRSSSPPPQPKPQISRKKAAKGPTKAKSHSRMSSAPSPLSSTFVQSSPVRPTAVKPLTTATLQNLLPRRRTRRKPRGDYDIPSSSDVELDNRALGEDEDELSFNAATKMRRKKSIIIPQKGKAKAKKTVPPSKGKKISRTYTRKSIVISDNEDESASGSDDSNAGQHGVRARSKTPALNNKAMEEMRRLAEKFREVDEYTLDFEDMTGSSSQMKDAR